RRVRPDPQRADDRTTARALRLARGHLARAGAGDRPQGRPRLHLRRARGGGRPAGRDGQVPCTPREESSARAARAARRSMTAPTPPFGRETIESIIPPRPPLLLR